MHILNLFKFCLPVTTIFKYSLFLLSLRKMRSKPELFSFIFILSIFMISAVSAEIWFVSQPKPLYNIGDNLEVSVSVSSAGEQLRAELACGTESKTLFLKYLANETAVDIFQPLTKSFLGEMKGDCKITALCRQEEAESSNFAISDSIFLEVETDNLNYNPGENIKITGKAQKANTQLLTGFFELSFDNSVVSGIVGEGRFETNFSIPEELAAGSYLIDAKVYEKEGEKITNEGEKQASINVKQMPEKIDVALDSVSVKPGNKLDFKIMLYDQSGNAISGDASFLIEDSEGNSFYKSLTKTDKAETFFTEKNLSSGYYKIKAQSSNIYGEREFYIEENEEAEFRIINGTLAVKNTGNVKYNKAIQVKINDIVEIINPELDTGQEKKYELAAPDGEYSVAVTDGKSSLSNAGVALTGEAVSVREAGGNFFGRGKILAWIFIILVMGMFIFVASRRTLKKKFVLSEPGSLEGMTAKEGSVKIGKTGEKLIMQREIREAEHSAVIKGQKQDAALICLKIKNNIGRTARENLEKIFEKAYENKAVIYKSGGYAIAIFSPLITRTFKNHSPAVNLSLDIARTLEEYNKKFQDRIEFGISVHSGDIVGRIQDNKLMFTSLGNAVTLAKRIADASEGEVLLSKELHQKTMADVKADRKEKNGLEVFTVSRIANKENNSRFIQDFLKRQGL